MNSFELYGLWWLPNCKEKIFAGTVIFNPKNGGTLNLIHGKDDRKYIREILHSKITIINGIANQKEITLLNCEPSIIRHTDIFSTYSVEHLIIGKQFENELSLKTTDFFLQISYMEYWLNKQVFKDDINEIFKYQDEQGEPAFKLLPKEKTKIFIDDELELELHNSCDIKGDLEKYKIDKKPYLLIKCSNPKSINEIEDIIYHLRDFFSLATSKPVYINELKSISKSNYYNVEYFFRRKFGSKDLTERLHPLKMIFNYNDIEKNVGIETALRNWFSNYNELKHIYRMFFLTHYSNDVLESKYLSLSQALDSYSNYYFDKAKIKDKNINKSISSTEFRRRKKVLLDSLPSDESKEVFSNWLNDCLQNFIPFSLRIEKLLTNEFNGLYGIKNLDKLTKAIVSVRNALSHGHSDTKNDEVKYLANIEDFIWLFFGEKMILTSIFLKNIGFKNNEIKKLLKRYFRYKDIINGNYVFD